MMIYISMRCEWRPSFLEPPCVRSMTDMTDIDCMIGHGLYDVIENGETCSQE